MEINQFLLIAGGGLLFSLILLAIGITLYRSQKQTDEAKEADKSPARRPAASSPPPAPAPAVAREPAPAVVEPHPGKPVEVPDPMPAPAPGDPLEIMRVYRRPIDGSLSLQVMGRSADHVGEMTPGQVEQLKRVVREIAMWVESKQPPPPARSVETPAPPAAGRPVEPVVPETGGMGAGAGTGRVSPPPPPGPQAAPGAYFADSLPPMPGPADLLLGRRKKAEKSEETVEPPKSIAAQIDEILQGILAAAGMHDREIGLNEDPGGGLNIMHGARTYQAIDDVEDEQVRALIKQAVRTWNERNKFRS